ncbi:MAG TPA: hypothetical protein VHZ97_29430 [Pseudonocardiaceae bacterium]|nr:hypothetical protein [Pseudonocardiaceae bacterium]
MNEPTPDEAAAALRAVHDGRERVIKSAIGSRWVWIAAGLFVFLYSTATDLFPKAGPGLSLAPLAVVLVMVVAGRTRVGSSLLGRQVTVSSRTLEVAVKWRLLRVGVIVAVGIAVAATTQLLHLPHAGIYYGALVGLYIIFLGPRFSLWLLRRQGKD